MRMLFAVVALAFAACTSPAAAQETKAGTLTIAEPWARATPPGAKVGAGYLRITNTGLRRTGWSASPPRSPAAARCMK